MLKQSIQKNMPRKKKCFAIVNIRHKVSFRMFGKDEAMKLQSAMRRHREMLTREV